MKTLYVTDLDGTLLNSEKCLSPYTIETIEALSKKGICLTYATARSYYTAKEVTKGFQPQVPVIIYNGTMIIDSATQDVLIQHTFLPSDVSLIQQQLKSYHIHPIVYAFIDGKERFSYVEKDLSQGARDFVQSRSDARKHPLDNDNHLFDGDVFYIAMIGDNHLEELYHLLKDNYRCLFQKDLYSGQIWLEILPQQASKAHAIQELKAYLKMDQVIVFGDGVNDIEMFQVADECYATKNAVDELKKIATGVIKNHNEDAVVSFIKEREE